MKRSVVVIGNFDGVHRGHQAVITAAQQHCDRLGETLGERPHLVVITFEPHPLSVIAPEHTPQLLMDLPDRISALTRAGADEVRVVQFTADVAQWSPQEFVDKVINPLNPVVVVVGEDFRFGHRASGTVATLVELGQHRFDVQPMQMVATEQHRISSSYIRQLVAVGDVDHASDYLGRDFTYHGVVVMGDQRGRHLGFPTANLTVPNGMVVPADGVYAGWLARLDQPGSPVMPAAISVGTNPTFDGIENRVESYVLDRTDLELYGVEIRVGFVSRLRGQVKFNGVTELIEQMDRDVAQVRDILADVDLDALQLD